MWNLLRLFLIVGFLISFGPQSTFATDAEEECENPEQKVRLVTPEELSTKTGEDGSEIWLSVMGDVFDVSAGVDFYGPGASYGAFAARDASVCFCTGIFTAEEAKRGTEIIPLKQLPALLEWQEFYSTHETYKFVGHLVDLRYYDENGNPTPRMDTLQGRLETQKLIMAEQKAKVKKR